MIVNFFKKHRIEILIISFFIIFFSFSSSVVRSSDIVFDPPDFIYDIQQFMEQVKQYENMVQQLNQQYKQVESWKQQLKSANPGNMYRIMGGNSQEAAMYNQMRNKTLGLFRDIKNIDSAYDNLYGSYQRIKTMTPKDLVKNRGTYINQLENATKSAAGIVETLGNMGERKGMLESVASASSSASGGVAATQYNSEILSLLVREVQNQNVLLSKLIELEVSRAGKEVAEEQDDLKDSERYFSVQPEVFHAPFSLDNPPKFQ